MSSNLLFKKKKRSCKKGNVGIEVILFIVFMFVLAIGLPIAKYVLNSVSTDINADPDFRAEAKAPLLKYNTDFSNSWDGLYAFLFVGIMISLVVASYFIDTYPIFIVVIFFLIIPVVLIGMTLSNFHEEFMADSFASENAGFPMTNFLMNHLPQVAIITLLLVGLSLYAKGRVN